jgi:hypothetical protein
MNTLRMSELLVYEWLALARDRIGRSREVEEVKK